MIVQTILIVLGILAAGYVFRVGEVVERFRVYKILNKTVDRIDEISEKSVDYRLGYLAALDIIGQEVHEG